MSCNWIRMIVTLAKKNSLLCFVQEKFHMLNGPVNIGLIETSGVRQSSGTVRAHWFMNMKSQGFITWSDLTGKTSVSPISWCPSPVSGSDAKSVCPTSAADRPKPRPFKQPEPLAATTAPKKVTSKPAPNPKPSNEKQEKAHPKLSQPKAFKAKSELSMG